MIVFNQTYTDESLVDIDEDIRWALQKDFADIPQDEYGFRKGQFHITIKWSNNENE